MKKVKKRSKQKTVILEILQDTLETYDQEMMDLETTDLKSLARAEWLEGAAYCCTYLINRLLKETK